MVLQLSVFTFPSDLARFVAVPERVTHFYSTVALLYFGGLLFRNLDDLIGNVH